MSSKEIMSLKSSLKHSFEKIKEEFDMHLTSINDNTSEIGANADRITELDEKINKLGEKLEEVLMMLSQLPKETKAYMIKPLTINEKQVLMAIYASSEPMSYTRLARNLNMTESVIKAYIESIISKKIPIIMTYKDATPYVAIDESFKEAQAKENILGIEQKSLNETFDD